jgi:DNA-binding GntR family transcriptional regulator
VTARSVAGATEGVTSSQGKLVRTFLSQEIAEILRNEILNGILEAGTHLGQRELCVRFGTSRMPVRDALRQLSHEGLLREVSGRLEVMPIDEDELRETYRLVTVLHAWAARQVAERGCRADLDELQSIHSASLRVDDQTEFTRISWHLHQRINELAGSRRLIDLLSLLQRTTPRAFPVEISGQVASARRQHAALLKAMKSGDGDLAERLARAHVTEEMDALLRARRNLRRSSGTARAEHAGG